jgi:beta-aspartyl-peptidase (threonine type)
VLVIHGGAGVLKEKEMKDWRLTPCKFERALARSLAAGYKALQKGGTSVDAVEAAVRVMEDCGRFNAGAGAAFDADGRIELDAAIMEGNMTDSGEGTRDPRQRAGAVAAISHIKNPISAARAVMEMPDGRSVLLVGDGAERFSLQESNRSRYHIEQVNDLYFWTPRRVREIYDVYHPRSGHANRNEVAVVPGAKRQAVNPSSRFGTVGAVACDHWGHLAAGTSTGGLTNKMPGRVGDSPLIGCGTYADDRACGVSCTGTGEVFIRHVVAHDVAARKLYGGKSLADAVKEAISELPDDDEGVGGLIALDSKGHHAFGMSAKTAGMYRGYATDDGKFYVGIDANKPEKLISLETPATHSAN